LPLPTGAATAANQPTNAAQGSTTSGQTGSLIEGAVTAASPTYTTGQTNPLSLDTAGNLRVNVIAGSASGNVGQASTTAGETGPMAQGAVTTAAPSYTTGQTNPLSLNVSGGLRVDGSGVTQPVSAASLPLPTGAATAANQPTNATPGSTTSAQTGTLGMMAVVSTAPSFTGGQTQPLNCDLVGALRVNVGAAALPSPQNLATGQVSVGTTATLIVAQRSGRYGVTLINKGSTEVDIGGSSVTTSTGSPLPAVQWASKTILTTAAIYGIVASGTQTVAFEELF
jgi:hypothetical protein